MAERICEGALTFYPPGDGWSVAENDIWVPGIYDTMETARVALAFESDVLQAIQDTKSPGPITMADLPR